MPDAPVLSWREYQTLRLMGCHRNLLSKMVTNLFPNEGNISWLDEYFTTLNEQGDFPHKGIRFLGNEFPNREIFKNYRTIMPDLNLRPVWDAVAQSDRGSYLLFQVVDARSGSNTAVSGTDSNVSSTIAFLTAHGVASRYVRLFMVSEDTPEEEENRIAEIMGSIEIRNLSITQTESSLMKEHPYPLFYKVNGGVCTARTSPETEGKINNMKTKGESMNTFENLKERQRLWAKSRGLQLQGSQGVRGEPNYTMTLEDNLFQPLTSDTQSQFLNADGNELSNGALPSKMQALHSSSALAVNVFDYWIGKKDFSPLAKALKIPTVGIDSISMETKFPIFPDATVHPNLDVAIKFVSGHVVGVECKFTETFSSRNGHLGLKEKYLVSFSGWEKFPALRKIAEQVSPVDKTFKHLDCAQLIKHTLGLFSATGNKTKFRLHYLYMPSPLEDNTEYEMEIKLLSDALQSDGVTFTVISWQDIFAGLEKYTGSEDKGYLNYLKSRYL